MRIFVQKYDEWMVSISCRKIFGISEWLQLYAAEVLPMSGEVVAFFFAEMTGDV